jgi:hypothetical protein
LLVNVFIISLIWIQHRHMFGTPQAARERVSEAMPLVLSVQRATPRPQPPRRTTRAKTPVPTSPNHELARIAPHASPQPPQRPHVLVSRIARDEARYAKEVARLNAGNDPHALPTIDPASRESSVKTYTMQFSSGNGAHGNGYIFPTRNWNDRGMDCYYGRYEYTYPDGAEEDGNIVWPFCFEPSSDPFKQPPHPMPFPEPMVGFVLTPGTQMPPLERQVYEAWIAGR